MKMRTKAISAQLIRSYHSSTRNHHLPCMANSHFLLSSFPKVTSVRQYLGTTSPLPINPHLTRMAYSFPPADVLHQNIYLVTDMLTSRPGPDLSPILSSQKPEAPSEPPQSPDMPVQPPTYEPGRTPPGVDPPKVPPEVAPLPDINPPPGLDPIPEIPIPSPGPDLPTPPIPSPSIPEIPDEPRNPEIPIPPPSQEPGWIPPGIDPPSGPPEVTPPSLPEIIPPQIVQSLHFQLQ